MVTEAAPELSAMVVVLVPRFTVTVVVLVPCLIVNTCVGVLPAPVPADSVI